MKRQQKQFREMLHVDELERLQNMGELMIFSEIPSSDYLEAAHPEDWALKSEFKSYHPVGTSEYEHEYLSEHKHKSHFRFLSN